MVAIYEVLMLIKKKNSSISRQQTWVQNTYAQISVTNLKK